MNSPTTWQLDPVYLNARREAAVVMLLFTLALTWSVGCYYFLGYIGQPVPPALGSQMQAERTLDDDPRFRAPPVSMVWGIPTWVFMSIVVPWLVIDGVAFWFCFHYMADDDLGEADEEDDVIAAEPA